MKVKPKIIFLHMLSEFNTISSYFIDDWCWVLLKILLNQKIVESKIQYIENKPKGVLMTNTTLQYIRCPRMWFNYEFITKKWLCLREIKSAIPHPVNENR